ncbi:MAG TPA: TadE/TadG family type IV pilus assembly protein [Gemmatimonadota bacterium]|nr:TadE/TadG family type IV pilus assembly protein [Gemmatimonadota bacterium]
MASGQSLVEFALLLPVIVVLLGLVLGGPFALWQAIRMQNAIAVLAELAAADPTDGWRAEVAAENERVGCNANPLQPDEEIRTTASGMQVKRLVWHCSMGVWFSDFRWPVTVESEAVVPFRPQPTPGATP